MSTAAWYEAQARRAAGDASRLRALAVDLRRTSAPLRGSLASVQRQHHIGVWASSAASRSREALQRSNGLLDAAIDASNALVARLELAAGAADTAASDYERAAAGARRRENEQR